MPAPGRSGRVPSPAARLGRAARAALAAALVAAALARCGAADEVQDEDVAQWVESTVPGAGESPTDPSRPVKPPESKVVGCKSCAAVDVPSYCGEAPKLRDGAAAQRRRLLGKGGGHKAFQSADRTTLAKSRQPDFAPPSASQRKAVEETYSAWRAGKTCSFWTKTCAERYFAGDTMNLTRGPAEIFPKRKVPDGMSESDIAALLPDIGPGDLGACALVAVGDNMLRKGRGPEIDAHDTVIRYNGPVKAYARDIGTKSDILYWKQRRNEAQYGVEGQKANTYYMWKEPSKYEMFGDKKEFKAMTFRGKQLLWPTQLSGNFVGNVYNAYKEEHPQKGRRNSPSGGFKLAAAFLASGFCTRLDLYGYSAYGGGRYFKDHAVDTVHLVGLEHWSYRTAMEAGHGVCVYD